MNDPEETAPDRSKTALYTWEGLPGATKDEPKVHSGAPDVVGVQEACELLGVSPEALDELRKGEFPAATDLQCGPVWDGRRVREYAAQHKPA
jgi:hypothetical protein